LGLAESYRLRLIRKRLRLRALRKSRELHPVQNRTHSITPGAQLLFCTLRDELVRLPYFYEYYRKLGIDHFLMVDNGSQDGTREFLADQPDTSVWHAKGLYRKARFGVDWLNFFYSAHMLMVIGVWWSIQMSFWSFPIATVGRSPLSQIGWIRVKLDRFLPYFWTCIQRVLLKIIVINRGKTLLKSPNGLTVATIHSRKIHSMAIFGFKAGRARGPILRMPQNRPRHSTKCHW
jgi:hypothetical protein